jgi:hypothetical protein
MPSRGVDGSNETFVNIPGRTVILQQKKKEMGAMRFILQDLDLVGAATDLPDSEDYKKTHYSKIHVKSQIFGVNNLYRDQEQANEDILIKVIG